MKKKMLWTIVFLSVVVIIVMLSNPLMRSEKALHKKIMKDTPLGTKMEDVLKYIDSKNWEVDYLSYEQGYREVNGYPPVGTAEATTGPNGFRVIGVKSIVAIIGSYKAITETNVDAFWEFNERSELIYFQVRKSTDSL